MNGLTRLLFLMVYFLLEAFIVPRGVIAFNDEAHKALSARAVKPDASILDSFLRNILGIEFPDGVGQQLDDRENGTVEHLISKVGAVDEDWGTRPVHHFHNPTKAWNQAGLWLCSPFCESSIVWSQDQNQIVGGKHSWYDARNSYFQALTATSDSERKRLYAETFTFPAAVSGLTLNPTRRRDENRHY